MFNRLVTIDGNTAETASLQSGDTVSLVSGNCFQFERRGTTVSDDGTVSTPERPTILIFHSRLGEAEYADDKYYDGHLYTVSEFKRFVNFAARCSGLVAFIDNEQTVTGPVTVVFFTQEEAERIMARNESTLDGPWRYMLCI